MIKHFLDKIRNYKLKLAKPPEINEYGFFEYQIEQPPHTPENLEKWRKDFNLMYSLETGELLAFISVDDYLKRMCECPAFVAIFRYTPEMTIRNKEVGNLYGIPIIILDKV